MRAVVRTVLYEIKAGPLDRSLGDLFRLGDRQNAPVQLPPTGEIDMEPHQESSLRERSMIQLDSSKCFFNITVMPKIVDHEERRRAIASAAVDAISANGLSDVKLSDIARTAGVTTGSIAHYFSDKDAVLAAALEEVCTRLFVQIGGPDKLPSVDEIVSVLPINDDKRKEWKVWLAYWGRAPHAPALAQIHRQYYAEIETAVAEGLDRIHPDPHLAAAAIIAAVDGIGTRATLEPELWPESKQRALLDHLISPIIATFKIEAIKT
jgi:TetR/AcrR family transcriptional regulator, transcriptional repressor of bet genes